MGGGCQPEPERGKLGPKEGIPIKLQIGFQFLTKLPEILDGQHLPGGSQPEISAQEETQDAPDRARPETEAGTAEGRKRTAPGRVRSSSSRLPEPLRRGKA